MREMHPSHVDELPLSKERMTVGKMVAEVNELWLMLNDAQRRSFQRESRGFSFGHDAEHTPEHVGLENSRYIAVLRDQYRAIVKLMPYERTDGCWR